MAIQIILLLGAAVLLCGSVGLLIVRLSNPLLRGLGWLGAAFATGAAGSVLLACHGHLSDLATIPLADVLVLAAFVLLNVAVLELSETASLFPTFGVALLTLQAVADLTMMYTPPGYSPSGFRIMVAGLLIAAVCAQIAWDLLRMARRTIRTAAWFTAVLLIGFMLYNVARALALGLGILRNPASFYREETITFGLFIAVALGIAFGFFWMTTAVLTTGLEQMASTDPLTRIYNRRVFLMWCEKELARGQRTGTPFSVLMVDLDHFKQINDCFGHQAGDLALCAVVEKMQDSVRGIDILGRWGGEEFAVLLPGAAADAALLVAQRVRRNIERILLPGTGIRNGERVQMISVTASVGIATYRGVDDTVHTMIERADMALYQAKAAGRNCVLATA
ncbi:MAG TPA: GGDEF domain-containing protein [Acidobacteriaceae bacterium]|jgi:diguanylate cyclase (GGDEF)-like protein|nr:GGDEF domain-containing protein [Acidobacteriaceae bacterium]